jgi:hypothetical protein
MLKCYSALRGDAWRSGKSAGGIEEACLVVHRIHGSWFVAKKQGKVILYLETFTKL